MCLRGHLGSSSSIRRLFDRNTGLMWTSPRLVPIDVVTNGISAFNRSLLSFCFCSVLSFDTTTPGEKRDEPPPGRNERPHYSWRQIAAPAGRQAIAHWKARTRSTVSFDFTSRNRNPGPRLATSSFNRTAGLARTLASMCSQTYRNIEIIVSDNASTDPAVRATVDEFAAKDPRISYHRHSENLGGMANFSSLVRKGSGDFFM